MINVIRWGAAIVLGLFLIAMGVMKFTGAHIFQFIEARATAEGLPLADLFHPLINNIVGGAEILAGLLVLVPASRYAGTVLGLLILLGALAFHLSPTIGLPYLGVSTPTGFAEGAGPPWELSDFTPSDPSQYSPMLFIIALVMTAVALLNLRLSQKS